jgi:hypothetical protein
MGRVPSSIEDLGNREVHSGPGPFALIKAEQYHFEKLPAMEGKTKVLEAEDDEAILSCPLP